MTTHLYTCRTYNQTGWMITKLDGDYNPEASYILFESAKGHWSCTCPQGERDKPCKHTREMLPFFKRHNHIGDGWFLNWDNRQWRPAFTGELGERSERGAHRLSTHGASPAAAILPLLREENAAISQETWEEFESSVSADLPSPGTPPTSAESPPPAKVESVDRPPEAGGGIKRFGRRIG